jgi:hypothetical protein
VTRTLAGYLLCFTLLLGAHAAPARAQQPSVRVEMNADRTELTTSDNVAVRIYVQTQGAGQPDIEVPEFEGFQVVQRAVQRPMQFSFGFGQAQPVVTSTTQYTFVLVPMGAGTFKIPPVKVTLNQRVFQSKPLVLTVTGGQQAQPLTGGTAQPQQQGPANAPPPDQDPQLQGQQPQAPAANGGKVPAAQNSGDVAIYDQEAFLRTVVDKLEPYEGEQVTATIYLYTRHNLQQVPAVQTEASTDGFWVQDLLSATRSLEPKRQVINGRGFWVYVLRRFAGFPLRSGDLTIGSMALTVSRESIFDLFDPQRGPADLERRSVPVLLHVKPLPADHKPSGPVAVGNFDIKATLDRPQVVTGDAVTLTATVRGDGNLRAIKLDDPQVKGLQILQPEVHDLTESPGDRVQSTRTFAWLIVPQAPGTYQIPALTLDTFDPAHATYKRISSERLTLTAAGAAPAGVATNRGANEGSDVADSSDKPEPWPPLRAHSELKRPETPLASRTFFPWAMLALPLIWLGSVLGPLAWAQVLKARGETSAEQLALRSARQRIHDAQRALDANDARRFHADIAAALNTTLEARLGEAVTGLTQNELRHRLSAHGMPESLSKGVCEVLATCDFARFSSASVSDADMRNTLARAEHLQSDLASFSPAKEAV